MAGWMVGRARAGGIQKGLLQRQKSIIRVGGKIALPERRRALERKKRLDSRPTTRDERLAIKWQIEEWNE